LAYQFHKKYAELKDSLFATSGNFENIKSAYNTSQKELKMNNESLNIKLKNAEKENSWLRILSWISGAVVIILLVLVVILYRKR
jgi:hypothetical protein